MSSSKKNSQDPSFHGEPPPLGDDGPHGGWRRFEQLVPDVVRKALLTGVGAVFLTEEGLRNALGDIKLPKEAVAYLVGQAGSTKRDMMQVLARELRSFLDDVDITSILRKVLAGMTVEFRTQVRFIPNAEHLEPKIEFQKVDRKGPDIAEEEEEAEPEPPKRKPRKPRRKKKSAPAPVKDTVEEEKDK